MRSPRRVLQASGAFSLVVGIMHLGMTPLAYDRPSFDTLWFAGSGVAVILIGLLTLLSSSAQAWRSLVAAAVGANLAGFVLAIGFGVLSDWREPQGPILTLLFAAGAIGCLRALTRQ